MAGTTVAELDSGRWPPLTPCSSDGSLYVLPQSKQGKGYISCDDNLIFHSFCFCRHFAFFVFARPRRELASDYTEVMMVHSI